MANTDNLQQESVPPKSSDEQGRDTLVQIPLTGNQHERLWIRYRTEYRDQSTNDVVWEENSRTPTGSRHDGTDSISDPIFEILTTYKARGDSTNAKRSSQPGDEKREGPPPRSFGAPPYHKLRIYSPALRNALNSVVQYYPSQSLNGDVLEINWPYPVLVHHYDELAEFRRQVLMKKSNEMCAREIHAAEDIQTLLTYLDQTVMDDIKAEISRMKRGFVSFDNLWYAYRPGTTVINTTAGDKTWRAWVIREIRGGTFVDPPEDWLIRGWSLAFDGRYLGRIESVQVMEKFSGEFGTDWIRILPDNKDIRDEEAKKLVEYGKSYWNLVDKQCKYHAGDSCTFPYNKVSRRAVGLCGISSFLAETCLLSPDYFLAGQNHLVIMLTTAF